MYISLGLSQRSQVIQINIPMSASHPMRDSFEERLTKADNCDRCQAKASVTWQWGIDSKGTMQVVLTTLDQQQRKLSSMKYNLLCWILFDLLQPTPFLTLDPFLSPLLLFSSLFFSFIFLLTPLAFSPLANLLLLLISLALTSYKFTLLFHFIFKMSHWPWAIVLIKNSNNSSSSNSNSYSPSATVRASTTKISNHTNIRKQCNSNAHYVMYKSPVVQSTSKEVSTNSHAVQKKIQATAC